jgi:hypothetical protein
VPTVTITTLQNKRTQVSGDDTHEEIKKQNEKAITDLTSSDQRGLSIGHDPEYRSRQKKAE